MAAVELQARLVIRLVEIERCMRRDGQECRILDRAFGLRVEDLHRVLPFVELMLEELVVLFFLDIRLVLRPERLHGVQRARLDLFDLIGALDLLAFLVLRRLLESEVHLDWVADVVAVLLDEALELIIVREVLLCLLAAELLLEVQRDGRAALIELALLNRVGAVGCGLPLPGLLLACLARHDRHVVGHHEGRVEADTELADHLFVGQVLVLLLRLLELFEEGLRAGLRDRADVLDELFAVHADAVIGNRQRVLLGIRRQENLEVLIAFEQSAVRQALEMSLVDCIRCIGDELAQEDLVIRVDGVNHEVQQLFCLRLEFMCFFCHGNLPLFIWKI